MRQSVFISGDEVHGFLDLVLDIGAQTPMVESELTPDPIY